MLRNFCTNVVEKVLLHKRITAFILSLLVTGFYYIGWIENVNSIFPNIISIAEAFLSVMGLVFAILTVIKEKDFFKKLERVWPQQVKSIYSDSIKSIFCSIIEIIMCVAVDTIVLIKSNIVSRCLYGFAMSFIFLLMILNTISAFKKSFDIFIYDNK